MNAIVTRNLSKSYGKSRGIIDISLNIESGEIFGFIGPNGAGKSTTIRTLLGLLFPDSGSGRIFDLDIVKDTREIKRKVGYLPAEPRYYEGLCVMELLAYSSRFYKRDCRERIKRLAEIFSLDLEHRIQDLSRGNQKKVGIVQCLLHSPELLILDEPTSGLDPLMQARFFDVLREENRKGTTVFFSSHTLSEVQTLCRRVGIIKDGRIAAVEDIETLRKKQLRKVWVEFSRPVRQSEIICPGISALHEQGNSLKFVFSGDIKGLLKILAQLEVTDLVIEEPTLEEIFMHYYADGLENGRN